MTTSRMSVSYRRVHKAMVSLLALVVVIFSGLAPNQYVLAADENLSNPVNKTGLVGVPVAITDLEVTGDGNENIVLSITAEAGVFQFSNEDASVTGGGSNNVTVSGPREDVNTTLASLTYTASAPGSNTITVDYGSTVTGVIIDPIGGHAYKIIDADLTWNQARSAAKELSYGGVQGYLANITTQNEDEFIVEHLTGNGWIGASDQGSEDAWIWMDGPEANTQFWQGNNIFNGGYPVTGEGDVPLYNNWNWNEPNNSGDEDCAEYIVAVGWNDLDCDFETRNYVVEFGAASETPDQIIRQFDITISPDTKNIASCEQLFALNEHNRFDTINLTQDIDCQGVEAEPLFNNDGGFAGAFNGNGYTISNFTVDGEDSIGLFASATGAVFQDLTLDNFTLIGGSRVGALAGQLRAVDVTNVHVTNVSINAPAGWAGGLVGSLGSNEDGSTLSNVSATGNITSSGVGNVGGIAGFAEGNNGALVFQKTFADVDINLLNEDTEDFGGLIGELEIDAGSANASAQITNSYAWGDINGGDENINVGGLIGRIDFVRDDDYQLAALLENVYAKGTVTGGTGVGGLVGRAEAPGAEQTLEVKNSFATGRVVAAESAAHQGGFIARLDGGSEANITSTNNYWDQRRTKQDYCSEGNVVANCVAINAEGTQPRNFINNTTNAPLDTWDFEGIWVTNASVPPTFHAYEVADLDGDGKSDTIENAGPNNGDANGDGIPDNEQPNVISYVNPVTGNYAVFATSCASVENFQVEAESSESPDDGYDYPTGLASFRLICDNLGETADIRHYYYGVQPNENYVIRKWNDQGYREIPGAVPLGALIDEQIVFLFNYQITDGGEFDDNSQEDGVIVDPSGIAYPAPSQSSENATLNNLGLAGSGGNIWAVVGLAITLVVLSFSSLHYKKQHQV